MKIVKLTQTCSACPTQYEGKTDDGKKVYIRYRFGNFRMEVDRKIKLLLSVGNEMDGCMSLDEIKKLTKDLSIEWPEKLTPYNSGDYEE